MYRSYKNKDVKAVGILVPFDMIQSFDKFYR